MVNILVIHGPNLNLLGEREPAVYGEQTLEDINKMLKDTGAEYQVEVDCFQSNHEGTIVDQIQEARGRYQALIINAGAYSHYSIAILDALRSFKGPIIEVHLSNIYQRESYRHRSLISEAATGGIFGLGALGYKLALLAAIEMLKQ
ncbi:MAG TPA: type II 3-dehydroquinate dehydratase [Syntrophomonadaceae bacterium]|nr:type II 3-dehydroquinate dehydratase [Syntrophomonadaceae bacterium]HOQ09062.1 type II 3-dehydroquinate dehydratase [Syntrophomonadaceae bacterium]HPU48605.1 type II 3-dehydroquinate dehydratase [Syntrophomonadaceae bacterium]